MSSGQENGIIGTGLPIECFRCGICCIDYQPRVSVKEIETMAQRFSITPETFIGSYVTVTNVGYLLRQEENGCVFLTREPDSNRTSCAIYPFRPAICRNWRATLSRPQCRRGLSLIREK